MQNEIIEEYFPREEKYIFHCYEQESYKEYVLDDMVFLNRDLIENVTFSEIIFANESYLFQEPEQMNIEYYDIENDENININIIFPDKISPSIDELCSIFSEQCLAQNSKIFMQHYLNSGRLEIIHELGYELTINYDESEVLKKIFNVFDERFNNGIYDYVTEKMINLIFYEELFIESDLLAYEMEEGDENNKLNIEYYNSNIFEIVELKEYDYTISYNNEQKFYIKILNYQKNNYVFNSDLPFYVEIEFNFKKENYELLELQELIIANEELSGEYQQEEQQELQNLELQEEIEEEQNLTIEELMNKVQKKKLSREQKEEKLEEIEQEIEILRSRTQEEE